MKDAWQKVTEAVELISLPGVYLRLKNILDDPDYSIAKVAVVISQDPAITLRLLRLVNSSYYGLRTKVETVDRAISLLGTDQVQNLVLTTSVAQTFDGLVTKVMDMRRFWQQSVKCAIMARLLAYASEGCDGERLFVAGLLHDIGHLIMYKSIPDLSLEAINVSLENEEPVYKTERYLTGFDYAEVGGDVMQKWDLPQSLWETTKYHIEPSKAEKYPLETALLHIASILCRTEAPDDFDQGSLKVDPFAWNVTGLTPEKCLDIKKDAESEVNAVTNLIFR